MLLKNGEVVSDTPDPTHAQFESAHPEKSTDMYFFNEDVKLGSEIEDIFETIDDGSSPAENEDAKDGGEE